MSNPADNEEKPEAAPENAGAVPSAKPAKKPLPAWVTLAGIVVFVVVALSVSYLIWLLANTFQLGRPDTSSSSGRVVEKNVFEDAQGWGSELLIDKKLDMPARIRFLLRDKDRRPITDATVDIFMTRKEDAGLPPVKASLKMMEPGVYRGEVDIPQGGLWEARIQVTERGNAYQITQRVKVPESAKEKAAKEATPGDGK